jgi:serine/threonine protein kinase
VGYDAERWERIKQLFQAALDRPIADRSVFLREECGRDVDLLVEMESLLDAHASAGSFAARPAIDVLSRSEHFEGPPAGQEIAPPPSAFATGERLGAYRILSRLGSGGMGDVYRALDSTLGREVAIKVLPAIFTTDPDRLARFEREARVLAALNHSHIGAIYGLENVGGSRALILELIEGPTLAERLAKGPLSIKAALSIAAQIAEALEAAHERGVVHRDLKPANIKVTTDERVKILDFGLAKTLISESAGASVTSSPTGTAEPTRDGLILGTATYMSPEQARGLPVDRRTDIWAFGCVLYEMLTARPAFDGDTIIDTIAAIIERDPDWRRLPAATPQSVRQLLRRCLRKDPKHRLRDAADARFVVEDTLPEIGSEPVAPVAVRGRSSHGHVLRGVAVLAIVLGVAGWWTAYEKTGSSNPFPENPLANAQFTRFTDFPGSEQDAAISPDGKFVVFVSDRDGPFDVWLSQVGTGVFTNLTHGRESVMELIVRHVGISHDGSEIWLAGRYPDRRLRVMPLVGGTAKVFLDGNVVNAAWSPDGALIAYHTGNPGDPLFVADHTGANARQIFINQIPGGHNHFPTWSPDGKWIYFVAGVLATRDMDLWRISPSGGEPQRMTSHDNDLGYPTAIDSHTLLYLSPADDGSGPWVWGRAVARRAPHPNPHGRAHRRVRAGGRGPAPPPPAPHTASASAWRNMCRWRRAPTVTGWSPQSPIRRPLCGACRSRITVWTSAR